MSVRMKGFFVLSIAAAAIFIRSASAQAPAAQHFVIAFNQQSGLPANVDSIVRNAGGTITERVPEIGGIGVVSSSPSFAAAIAANASVKSVDLATSIGL